MPTSRGLTTSLQHTGTLIVNLFTRSIKRLSRNDGRGGAEREQRRDFHRFGAERLEFVCDFSGRPRALDRSAQVRVRLLFARHQRADERQYEAQPQPQHRAENSRRRKRI